MNRKRNVIAAAAALIVLLLLTDAFFIVDETHQAIITQFGEPVGPSITTAGLKFKLPLIQKAILFEKRVVEWDGDQNQIPTNDKKYLLVDTFARWRIVDPLRFYQSVNNERNAQSRLDDIIDGVTRDFISGSPLIEVVRNSNRRMELVTEEMQDVGARFDSLRIENGRLAITRAILVKVQEIVPQYGIEVLDIRIKQVNYIEEVRQKVYERMISERRRIAQLYRSEGQGRKAEIDGRRLRELQRIESEAYRRAQEIKGRADGEAVKIYASAYSHDPELYSLMQALESYRATLDSNSTLILSTDSEYLKYLKKGK